MAHAYFIEVAASKLFRENANIVYHAFLSKETSSSREYSTGFSKIGYESVYFLIAYPATGITISFLSRESNVSYLKTGREKWKGLHVYIGNEIFKEIISLLKVNRFILSFKL